MARGYNAMMGKGGSKMPPKPPGMSGMNGMRKPDMMSKGMSDDPMMTDEEMEDSEDMMMGDEYSPEQMSLANDAMMAAKNGDGTGFLRAIHAIMDSYEMPKPGPMMTESNGESR